MSATTRKRRKLQDLYRRGRLLTLDDGDGEVSVWVQKLNPVENETAARKASAARAQFMVDASNHEGELYLSTVDEFKKMDHDDLVDYFVNDEVARQLRKIEERIAEENDWNKDDYLAGLLEAWNEDGLMEAWFKTEDEEGQIDPEAERVYRELERYNDQVEKAVEEERLNLREQVKNKDDEKLLELIMEKVIDLQADLTWMIEYRKCEILLGTRDPDDQKVRYFSSRREIDDLAEATLTALLTMFQQLNVDTDEGKDLRATTDSSDSSESPEPQEEETDSSGLEVVKA